MSPDLFETENEPNHQSLVVRSTKARSLVNIRNVNKSVRAVLAFGEVVFIFSGPLGDFHRSCFASAAAAAAAARPSARLALSSKMFRSILNHRIDSREPNGRYNVARVPLRAGQPYLDL